MSRSSVEDAVIAMFVATDRREWAKVAASFTDPFILDMTSLVGGDPLTLTPNSVCEMWAEGFRTLDHVHHQVGNFQTQISGEQAQVECYGVAWHYRAAANFGKTRLFVGTYVLDLTLGASGWQIGKLTFRLKFMDGNLSLE